MTDYACESGNRSENRRDFLLLTAGALATAGGALSLWPFVHSLNPTRAVLALETIEVDLSSIEVGQAITVMWQGKPVFVRRRTSDEIHTAARIPLDELIDPQADAERVVRPDWIVVVGVCTHFGCVPQGQRPTQSRGDFSGWHCACHNSHYDVSGRIRKGPAPQNLAVPPYKFLDDTTIRIG